MLSGFHVVPERNGQTDRWTDGRTNKFAISISRVSMLMRDKKRRNDAQKSLKVTIAQNSGSQTPSMAE